MMKFLKLLFIVKLLTDPVIGKNEQRVVNRTLACLENKLDFVFKSLATLGAEIKTNNPREHMNLVTRCHGRNYYLDMSKSISPDPQTSLERMWIKTNSLYTGFKDLKKTIRIPIEEQQRVIDQIVTTQSSLLQRIEDQERYIKYINELVDSTNTLKEDNKLLKHEMQTLKEATNEDAKLIKNGQESLKRQHQALHETVNNVDNSFQATVTDITTVFDDKLGGIETRLDNMTQSISYLKQSAVLKECPKGWQLYDDSCYYLNTSAVEWKDAVNKCKYDGAHLVEYDDMSEIHFVLQLAKTTHSWGSAKWRGFYIGGNDLQSEGNFIWETSKTSVQPLYWLPGEPNNSFWNDEPENCMETLVNEEGRWNDDTCSSKKLFVCEKKWRWENKVN